MHPAVTSKLTKGLLTQAIPRLEEWVNINTHSLNLEGLAIQEQALRCELESFGIPSQSIPLGTVRQLDQQGEWRDIPLGNLIRAGVRPKARHRLLVMIHYDTVFAPDHPFQQFRREGQNVHGPGVADAKGGLLVLLESLRIFETAMTKRQHSSDWGWDLLLNPDEEIGSIGSTPFLREVAASCDLAFVYEPCLENGALVANRKGSINIRLRADGRAAHAGRCFHEGVNAVLALSRIGQRMAALTDSRSGLTVNVASLHGGGPMNMVPDLATLGINIRVTQAEDFDYARQVLQQLMDDEMRTGDLSIELDMTPFKPPRRLADSSPLKKLVMETACELRQDLNWQDTGGVCDGNTIAATGTPVIDTMGVRGGGLHSEREYMHLDSLFEKIQLSVSLLERIHAGDFTTS